jgi:homoserine dehydrogenase
VSIATCHQRGRSERGAVPVIMVTHSARGGAIREALAEIDAARAIVKRKTIAIRIEE